MNLRKLLNRLLENTYNHFGCYLPRNFGFFTSYVLKPFFSGITLKKDQTRIVQEIPEDAIIVYVIKFKSKFAHLFYHRIYQIYNLPVPEIGLDYRYLLFQPLLRIIKILLAHADFFLRNWTFPDPYHSGYIRDELVKGRFGFLTLIEKGGFYRRFVKAKTDPVRYLVDIQNSTKRQVYLVPQLMFFSKNPHRSNPSLIDIVFGTEENPGKIRRLLTLLKNPRKVFVEISEPVNLNQFLEQPENQDLSVEHQAMNLRRHLLGQLNRHRQAITGPILQNREEIKENILTGERFREFMTRFSKSRNISIYEVRRKADAYLEEIASNYSTALIKVASVIVGWIINTMFEGVTTNNDSLSKIKAMSQKGPLILIPCHKSHIDYLILSYVLYHNNMPCPHIAAGKNLSFWPMGSLFRGGGAFFIRRTFRGARLYSKVFMEYIHKLLSDGFNIEFFIEGTRSRTGKLILPKLGLLSMLLDAYKNGACEDMIFVPIYIGYDRVLEESTYIHELEGKQKEPESLLQVIRARKFLRRRYGKIYIQFHDPLSLNDLLAQEGKTISDISAKEKNILCRNLGFRMINSINKETVVTAHGIMAGAALNAAGRNFSFNELKSTAQLYIEYLRLQNAKLADTLQMEPDHSLKNAFDSYVQRKILEPSTRGSENLNPETMVRLEDNQRPALEYYKNNCIAFFIPAAMTAVEILARDEFRFFIQDLYPGYTFQQKLFKYEFAYDIEMTPEKYVQSIIRTFSALSIITPGDTDKNIYQITRTGFGQLKLFGNFMKTYLESYLVVSLYLNQTSSRTEDSKERLKKIESWGIRNYKEKKIYNKESLSKVAYKNALDYYNSQKIKNSENTDEIEPYIRTLNSYINLLQS